MALRAIRNTYGYAPVGYGEERRLLIIAGQVVPPDIRVEDPTAVIDEFGPHNQYGYLYGTSPNTTDTPRAPEVEAPKVTRRARPAA